MFDYQLHYAANSSIKYVILRYNPDRFIGDFSFRGYTLATVRCESARFLNLLSLTLLMPLNFIALISFILFRQLLLILLNILPTLPSYLDDRSPNTYQ